VHAVQFPDYYSFREWRSGPGSPDKQSRGHWREMKADNSIEVLGE
jgi:hypothetical protein